LLPEPLHPSVVHFPIVLGLLLPVAVAVVLWRMHDGAPVRSWGVVALLALVTWGGGYLTARTGEQEEDRVERALADEQPLHEHEEAADFFLLLSGITSALAIVGFAPGVAGRAVRMLTLLGSLGTAGAVARTSKLGGDLVYVHGAAGAYTTGSLRVSVPSAGADTPDDADHEGHP